MIESGTLARFTPSEVQEFRQIGLDLSKVRHQDDIEREVSRWASTLAGERELGPGTVFRILRDLQRRYFDAPDFTGSDASRGYRLR